MADGLLTPNEAVNAFLKQQMQPQTLGPEAVVAPEQLAPGAGTTIPAQPDALLQSATTKQQTGVPLNQQEIDVFSQAMQKEKGTTGIIEGALPESVKNFLGKGAAFATTIAKMAALPSIGAAAGAAGGTAILPGPGTLLGAMAGSLAGTEGNFLLGLEKESDLARLMAVLFPAAGAGAGRVGKSILKATPAGQALRSGFAAELSEQAPKMVFQAPGQNVVDQAFNKVRLFTTRIDVEGLGRALDDIVAKDAKFGTKIVDTLRSAGPEAKAAINRIIKPELPSPRPADTSKLPIFRERGGRRTMQEIAAEAEKTRRFDITPGDLLEVRKAVKAAKDAAFKQKGFKRVGAKRQAQDLEKLSTIIDDTIQRAAQSGDARAEAMLEANLLARTQFAQDDLTKLFTSASGTKTFGGRAADTFDINKIDKALTQAKRAIRNNEPHKFADLVKTMDDIGELGKFEQALTQLRRLSPGENPLLIGQSFGILTRAAQVAGRTAGLNLIGEAMLNPVARNIMLQLVGVTKGTITTPILMAAVAAGRAATGQPLDQASEFILNKLQQDKQLATEAEIEQATTQEVTTPEFTIAGPRGAQPVERQDIRPAGPIFGRQ